MPSTRVLRRLRQAELCGFAFCLICLEFRGRHTPSLDRLLNEMGFWGDIIYPCLSFPLDNLEHSQASYLCGSSEISQRELSLGL